MFRRLLHKYGQGQLSYHDIIACVLELQQQYAQLLQREYIDWQQNTGVSWLLAYSAVADFFKFELRNIKKDSEVKKYLDCIDEKLSRILKLLKQQDVAADFYFLIDELLAYTLPEESPAEATYAAEEVVTEATLQELRPLYAGDRGNKSWQGQIYAIIKGLSLPKELLKRLSQAILQEEYGVQKACLVEAADTCLTKVRALLELDAVRDFLRSQGKSERLSNYLLKASLFLNAALVIHRKKILQLSDDDYVQRTTEQATDAGERELIAQIIRMEEEFIRLIRCTARAQGFRLYNIDHKRFLEDEVRRPAGVSMAEINFTKVEVVPGYLTLPEANKIQEVYYETSNQIKVLLTRMVKEAIAILGEPPCAYTLLCLGSLARQEMTPYSDIELAILLEKDTVANKAYFYNLSVLLAFSLQNLGETAIPKDLFRLGALESFDEIVRPGCMLDLGGKSPLGRIDQGYDLIQTPEKMAAYVTDEAFKLGELLPIEMLTCAYVCGEKALSDRYNQLITDILTPSLKMKRALTLLKKDLTTFDPMYEPEEEGKLFKVKFDIYRLPNLILDNLALFYNLEYGLSGWRKIEVLLSLGVLSARGAENLKKILSIATGTRLKVYLQVHAQNETCSALFARTDSSFCLTANQGAKEYYYIFSQPQLKMFTEVYKILFPLHTILSQFVFKQGGVLLADSDIYDNSCSTRGIIADRLCDYNVGRECFAAGVHESLDDSFIWKRFFGLRATVSGLGIEQGAMHRGLQHQKIVGDGDCLYRAVAYYLHRGDVSFLRDIVATNLESNLAEYSQFIPLLPGQTLENYIARVRGMHEWAGHLEINILMRLLNRPIVIIGPEGEIRNRDEVHLYKDKGEAIFVYYNGADHYDALVLREGYNSAAILADMLNPQYRSSRQQPRAVADARDLSELTPSYCSTLINISPEIIKQAIKMVVYGESLLKMASQGYAREAMDVFNKALALLQIEIDLPIKAVIFEGLGDAYGILGQFREEVKYLEVALQMKSRMYGKEDAKTVKAMVNLSVACVHVGDTQRQIELLEQSVDILERIYAQDQVKTTIGLMNLANAYGEKHYYDLQKEILKRILGIQENFYGRRHLDVADTLISLGNCYYYQGKYLLAKACVERALAIRKSFYPENHCKIAEVITKLGTICKALGLHDQAQGMLQQAMAINQGEGADSIEAYINSIDVNSIISITECEGHIQRLQAILAQFSIDFGPEHIRLAVILHNLGLVYGKVGNHEKKIEYLERALRIKEQYYGMQEDISIAQTLSSLSLAYGALGQDGKQKEAAKKALDAAENFYKTIENPIDLVIFLVNWSLCCGDVSIRIAVLERAARIQDNVYRGRSYPISASTVWGNLGLAYREQGEYEKAESFLNRALIARRSYYGGNEHIEVVYVLNNLRSLAFRLYELGNSAFRDGNFDSAKDKYEQALRLFTNYFGSESSIVEQIKQKLGDAYFKLFNLFKAKENYEVVFSMLLNKQGMNEKTKQIFIKLIAIITQISDQFWQEGAAKFFTNRFDESIGIFERLLALVRETTSKYGTYDQDFLAFLTECHYNCYYKLACAYRNKGCYEEALDCFERCVEVIDTNRTVLSREIIEKLLPQVRRELDEVRALLVAKHAYVM